MYLTSDLARIIGFDAQLIFDSLITAVNILILYAFLSYLLYNPVRKALSSRTEKIKKEIDDANNQLETANRLKDEYEKKLQDAKLEAESIKENARKNAKIEADEIVSNSKQEATVIKERTEKSIELEKQKAMEDLKNEVVNIASLLATKIVKKTIDKDQADRLFDETLAEIGASTWQK